MQQWDTESRLIRIEDYNKEFKEYKGCLDIKETQPSFKKPFEILEFINYDILTEDEKSILDGESLKSNDNDDEEDFSEND